MTATAAALQAQLGASITTFTFSYSTWAANWPTNANIAPCLAEYVAQVSSAYARAGGDGRVILVAHSMGGLAIRYASSAQYVANPITAAEAPLVITLDTPYLGSPWGGTLASEADELFGAVLGKSVPNPFGTDGGLCLQPHDSGQQLPAQCGGLPPWLPGGTVLDELGGDITIERTLLGVHLYTIDTGSDGIVNTTSSVGYRTSGPGGAAPVVSSATTGTTLHSQYVDCMVTTGQIDNALHALGGVISSIGLPVEELSDYTVLQQLQNGQETPAVMAYTAAALGTAGCSHINVTTDPDAVTAVAADIRSYLTSHPGEGAASPNSVALPVTSWTPVGGAVITPHDDGTFEVTYDPTYWGGIIATTDVGCSYQFSGEGQVIGGGGYGMTAWASVDADGVPHGRAIQYDLGIGGYRDTTLPDASETGPVQTAAVDNGWHSVSIQVVNGRYTSAVDGVTIFSGTMPGTCTNHVFIRLWNSDDVEFRDLTIRALGG